MSQPARQSDSKNAWSFSKFFYTLWFNLKELLNWFSPHHEHFPSDESGELMRRYMMQQSWFDRMSSNWFKQPFLNKVAYWFGVTLAAGLFGVILGSPIFLACTTGFLSLMVHHFFIKHEKNRWQRAKIFAEESIDLNKTLQNNKELFVDAANELSQATQELKEQTEIIQTQAVVLDTESKKIREQDEILVSVIDEVAHKERELIEQQNLASSSFKQMSKHLVEYKKVVLASSEAVHQWENTSSELLETSKELQHSHDKFSNAVNNFCFFVNARSQDNTLSSSEDEDNDFLKHLLKQNKEDDQLLESLGLKEAFQ